MDITTGTPVRIYWNLHKRCYSIQTKQPDNNNRNRWIVTNHTTDIHLTNTHFKVSKAGQTRVRQQNRKNVHAFIYGNWTTTTTTTGTKIKYDPYTMDTFQADGQPIHTAPAAHGTTNGRHPQLTI
jgi:hypothetical protein